MKSSTFLFFFAALFAFATSASSKVPPNQIPPSIQKQVENLRADLEARGFEVAQGAWKLFTIEDCKYAIASIGNCLGNNPAAPYIVPTVPLWPNEFADRKMKDIFGPTAKRTWWTYRLDPREALVVVGLMPPSGAYFGLQSYIFSREGALNANDEIFRSVKEPFMRSILFMKSPNTSRPLVFSSVGDSNNNIVIEKQSGAAFGQERSFIITPDAVMERQLTDALLRAGVPNRNQIFTEHVSADLARLGLGAKSDDMLTLMRYALPDDEAAGNKWRQQLPLVILRVRETNTRRATEPYPAPVRDTRVARSELAWKADAEKLAMAVKQKWGQANASTESFESLLLKVDLLGPHCLKRPQNCLGDTADADYQISATASLDSGEVLAAVGTLGTATGNALYTSLSVNQIPALKGVANISHKTLAGSASAFAAMVPNTERLYLQYFARDCGSLEHCFTVTEQMVPRGDKVKIIQRNYVVPGSARGPDPTQVVEPALLILQGAYRPASR